METATLQVSVKRMTKLDGTGSVKAFCDVTVADSLIIKGLKVVEGKNGLFVSMPREQSKQGKWYDTVIPLTKDTKEQLTDAVLQAYDTQAVVPQNQRLAK